MGRSRLAGGRDVLALINFDSSSSALLEQLLAEGMLPVLASLRERGCLVPLETPGGVMSASTYASVWSGVEPGDHGLYYPFQWKAEEQRVRSHDDFEKPEAIWERLSREGRQVIVVDAYEAWAPTVLRGTYLTGWQFTNRVVLRSCSIPATAAARWRRRLGAGRHSADEVFGRPTERALTRLSATLVGASARAADLVEAVLAEERADLLVVGLPAVHVGGHQLWDPASVLGAPTSDPLRNGLRDVYAAADAALGRIVGALPAGADTIVFSPIGMGPNTSRADLAGSMVSAVLNGDGSRPAPASSQRFRATVPASLRARVAQGLPDRLAIELACRVELRGYDWRRTRAFAVPSDTTGLIRINMRGREREGILDPGDVDALCAELAEGLASFSLPSGEPVVRSVEPLPSRYQSGVRFAQLPDLVVQWTSTPTAVEEMVSSPRFGTVRRVGGGTGRSGNHTPDAWALVVPGSSRIRETSRPAHVIDLAATAVSLHGLEPAGEPLLEPV